MALISIISAGIGWIVGGLGTCAFTFFFPPVSLCTGIVFFVGSIVSVVTGHLGRRQIKASGGLEGGDGMALTGLILGWIGVAITLLLFCLIVIGIVLLGPEIGNIYSDIIRELEMTPQP
jgi:hypothetical protein